MNYFTILISLCFVGLLGASEILESDQELFVALAMTKAQANSSLPTDAGLFIRDQSEVGWHRFGPKVLGIRSMTIDPDNPDRIFISGGNGILRTLDGGSTWKLVTGWEESDVQQLIIDPEQPSRLFAASIWGVYTSEDGGDSWKDANKGLEETFSRAIAFDSQNRKHLYLATGSGVFHSTNQAQSWKRSGNFPVVNVTDLDQSATNPKLWVAATEGRGVHVTLNRGRHWDSVIPELAEANMITVAIDPNDGNRLAAGGWGTGVWISEDAAVHWIQVQEGLPSAHITEVAFDPRVPGRLWVSTFEEGTFYTDDHGLTWESGNLDGAFVFELGFGDLNP